MSARVIDLQLYRARLAFEEARSLLRRSRQLLAEFRALVASTNTNPKA